MAVTAASPTLPAWELEDAERFAARLGIRHVVLPVSELNCPEFVRNDGDAATTARNTVSSCSAAGPENRAFLGDRGIEYRRPGGLPARDEGGGRNRQGEKSPSRGGIFPRQTYGDFPGNGAFRLGETRCCMPASRIAYGTPITAENLRQVEQAEDIVRSCCPPNVQIRVRLTAPRKDRGGAAGPFLLAEPKRAAGIAASLAPSDLTGLPGSCRLPHGQHERSTCRSPRPFGSDPRPLT